MNLQRLFLTTFLVFASLQANAIPITRVGFDPGAAEFDFSGLPAGQIIAGDGVLTVSNGYVRAATLGNVIAPAYYDGDDASVIRLDFSGVVSAVGMDFISYNADTTLSLFDAGDGLLESFTLARGGQFGCGGFSCGFAGIDLGSSLAAYATIDTPLLGNELYIDNIIYQSAHQSVPEPTTLAILGLGLAGVGFGRRNKSLS